jgi:ATP-dependent DNA helicase RecG
MSADAPESQHVDHKSLRKISGPTADFAGLAQDCVCFANSSGGMLLIGIEEGKHAPPATQHIEPSLLDRIRKRVGELTVNTHVLPSLRRHENGGEYIVLTVPRSVGVASTSDGRYFLRVGDTCRPVVGDDVLLLANERPATPWESMTSLGVPQANIDADKLAKWAAGIRGSDRVKALRPRINKFTFSACWSAPGRGCSSTLAARGGGVVGLGPSVRLMF